MARYEYRVITLNRRLLGDPLSADRLATLLNDEAKQGWRLTAITPTDAVDQFSPNSRDGLLVTFERPAQ